MLAIGTFRTHTRIPDRSPLVRDSFLATYGTDQKIGQTQDSVGKSLFVQHDRPRKHPATSRRSSQARVHKNLPSARNHLLSSAEILFINPHQTGKLNRRPEKKLSNAHRNGYPFHPASTPHSWGDSYGASCGEWGHCSPKLDRTKGRKGKNVARPLT